MEIFRRLYREKNEEKRNALSNEENRKLDELPIGVAVACMLDGIPYNFSIFNGKTFNGKNFEERKDGVNRILRGSKLKTKEQFIKVKVVFFNITMTHPHLFVGIIFPPRQSS
jgi:hypothetical protein